MVLERTEYSKSHPKNRVIYRLDFLVLIERVVYLSKINLIILKICYFTYQILLDVMAKFDIFYRTGHGNRVFHCKFLTAV